jgi:HAD superfamily hydrolase (TIGR01490 family)
VTLLFDANVSHKLVSGLAGEFPGSAHVRDVGLRDADDRHFGPSLHASPLMNLALFDFDGTITSTDSWTPFMRFAVPPLRLAAGRVLLLPVVIRYRLGAVSASLGREIAARVAFQGVRAAVIRQRGIEYATATLPLDVRPKALTRIEWHRSQGDHVVVVSGALDVYLAPWCQAQGLDLICTVLEERAGRFTGRYVHGDCSGAEKVRRIRERYELEQYAAVYAYGDSAEDREMLECAHQKYYRWNAISSWADVTMSGHPRPGRAHRANESRSGRQDR